jgi:recombination protein RecA
LLKDNQELQDELEVKIKEKVMVQPDVLIDTLEPNILDDGELE